MPKRINHIQLAEFSKKAVKNLRSAKDVMFLLSEGRNNPAGISVLTYSPKGKLRNSLIPYSVDPEEFVNLVTDHLLSEVTHSWAKALQIDTTLTEDLLALIDGFPLIKDHEAFFGVSQMPKDKPPVLTLSVYGGMVWRQTFRITPQEFVDNYEKFVQDVQDQIDEDG